MNQKINPGIFLLIVFVSLSHSGIGQILQTGQKEKYNPIATAVPFLMITPDSRHGGMGETGVATSPDANSQYFNPAKYAFSEAKYGFSLSYTPWLHQLVRDNYLTCLSGFYKLDDSQAFGSTLRYFSMGNVILTGEDQAIISTVRPNEYAFDFSYSRKLSDYLSGGVAMRYIHSDINGGIGSGYYTAANGFSVDLSFYYFNKWGSKGASRSIAFGANFSNIGSKISYDQGSNKEFLPANLKLGSTYTADIDPYSSLSLSLDLNKLLVPSPNVRQTSGSDENAVIVPSYNNNDPVISSIFNSFSDAPDGLREELKEINLSFGLEYWYSKKFAIRTGYFNEPRSKGNRKFLTAGAGVLVNNINIDFSYIIPTRQDNPLSNTIRFTLLFNVESLLKTKKLSSI